MAIGLADSTIYNLFAVQLWGGGKLYFKAISLTDD